MNKNLFNLPIAILILIGCTSQKPGSDLNNASRTRSAVSNNDILLRDTGNLIDAHLQQLTIKGFSGAVIVEINGEKILQAGYGFADRENKVPYTTKTISDLASLTKQFTATAIVYLSQAGYFKLRDSLGKFFPELQLPQSKITIEQVLTHSSGLSEYSGPDYKELSKEGLMQKVRQQDLEFEPGERYLYSNTGYSVLALLIEKITNKDYEEVVSDLFFKPNDLRIGLNLHDFSEDDFAVYYQNKRNKGNSYLKKKQLKENYWALKGNAGFYASADEVYRWHKTLQNDSLISPQVKAELFYPRFKRSENLYYGYGWNIRTDNTGKVNQISHGGSDDIMSCYWMDLPQSRTWIYVSSNNSEFKATSITLDILNIIKKRQLP